MKFLLLLLMLYFHNSYAEDLNVNTTYKQLPAGVCYDYNEYKLQSIQHKFVALKYLAWALFCLIGFFCFSYLRKREDCEEMKQLGNIFCLVTLGLCLGNIFLLFQEVSYSNGTLEQYKFCLSIDKNDK